MKQHFDYIVLGAGIYGMYISHRLACLYPQSKIALMDYDAKPFQRASYINQARVHNGYHYPRSLATALKSAGYYQQFIRDYDFAINKKFEKIYAVASNFSYASAENFEAFCRAAHIPCKHMHASKYFKDGMIDGCYLTEEFSLDAKSICAWFVEQLKDKQHVTQLYNTRIKEVVEAGELYELHMDDGSVYSAPFVLNTSYASVNQVLDLFGFEKFRIKYEIAEICLCSVTENVLDAGLTVMDGPFFSLMPFGHSGYHSLSSVHYTPHLTCVGELPVFPCQQRNPECTPHRLGNCNLCPARPQTAWRQMKQQARHYLNDDIDMHYQESLFAIKPILLASEISDSRPTIIKEFSNSPRFVSVLSGKFNTMYDLEEVLSR